MNPRFLLFLVFFLFAISISAQTAPADSGVKVVSAPVFNLPDAAVAAGIEGRMSVALTVDKTGEVKSLIPLAGPMWPCEASPVKELNELWAYLKENVKASKFSPAIKQGEPVSSDITLTIDLDKTPQLAGKASSMFPDNVEKKPKKINAGIVNGKATWLPEPSYPAAARANRVSGVVLVQVLIDEKGKVILAGVSSGHPLLQAGARTAACLSKFSPTKVLGEPVKVSGIITYKFMR